MTAARVLVERFGDDGRDTIRRAMRSWGRLRGEHLRREHDEKGIERSPVSFMHHHDLPFGIVWDVDEEIADDGTLLARIHDTPHDEAWRDLDGADLGVAADLGTLWYEESYAAMVEAYLPGARLEWTRQMCRGDAVTELRITA